jgi:hypothetical protein
VVLANIFHPLFDTFGPVIFLHSIIGSAAILAAASNS